MKKGESMNIRKLVLELKRIWVNLLVSDDVYGRGRYAKGPK
jgi:hypothetical protein